MNKRELNKANANNIIEIVNNYFNVNQDTKCRKINVMIPKQISQYFMRKKLKLSYQVIASMFNLKQHGTVMSNIEKMEGFSTHDREISFYIKELELLLRDNAEIMLYNNSIDTVEHLTDINKILDIKSVFQLRKIKEYLLAETNNI
tara:strand:+ start:38 stop:475 length:438 start_codon:yes stop_codon:yes gene_type:complete